MNTNSSMADPGQNPLAEALLALPNPFTPMAFLPPKVARELTVSLYIIVAAVTIQAWDMLSHLVEDYRLFRRSKIRLPMVVYVISRLTTLTFLLGYTVMNTAPIGRCEFINKIFIIFEAFSIPSSQLLFLLHVRAVYTSNKRLVYFFMFLWLCTVASSTAAPIAAYTASPFFEIGPTKYCIGTPLPPYIGALVIVPMVNDLILFLALAWRLQKSTYVGQNEKATLKSTVLGRHMPRISQALFQNGQAYFLTTVVFDITTVTLVYTNSVPLPFRDIMGFPGVVIMNVMASRIYRNINSRAFDPAVLPVSSSILDRKCNRKHVEEISLNPLTSVASSAEGSLSHGPSRYKLKENGAFPTRLSDQV